MNVDDLVIKSFFYGYALSEEKNLVPWRSRYFRREGVGLINYPPQYCLNITIYFIRKFL
jgi:hypothetical protein